MLVSVPLPGFFYLKAWIALVSVPALAVSVPLPGFFYLKVKRCDRLLNLGIEFQSRCRDSFI